MISRYYFHLSNGDHVVLDEDGLSLADVRSAAVYALETVEELKRECQSAPVDWHGWKLHIVDGSGRTLHSFPLDAPPPSIQTLH